MDKQKADGQTESRQMDKQKAGRWTNRSKQMDKQKADRWTNRKQTNGQTESRQMDKQKADGQIMTIRNKHNRSTALE